MEILIYTAVFLIGIIAGIIVTCSVNNKNDLVIEEWIKLLNEREKLLDQRDTERYQVFLKKINMKAYLVGYSRGSFDDVSWRDVFVTTNEEKAKAWCSRFNERLAYWKEVGKPMKMDSENETKRENVPMFYKNRYWQIEDTNESYCTEIDFRD